MLIKTIKSLLSAKSNQQLDDEISKELKQEDPKEEVAKARIDENSQNQNGGK